MKVDIRNRYLGSVNCLHKQCLYYRTLAFAWLLLAQVFVTAGQSASNGQIGADIPAIL